MVTAVATVVREQPVLQLTLSETEEFIAESMLAAVGRLGQARCLSGFDMGLPLGGCSSNSSGHQIVSSSVDGKETRERKKACLEAVYRVLTAAAHKQWRVVGLLPAVVKKS